MATVAHDPNKNQNSSTTNILDQAKPTDQNSYVSDGNPYGQYATPSGGATPQTNASQTNQITQTQSSSPANRKTQTGASSGQFTNVQTYANKNQQSSQKLGGAVENKLQNTADLVRQNQDNVNKKFQQGVNAGSLENYDTAVDRSKQAFNQAANTTAPSQQFVENTATMYKPTAQEGGGYSEQDQALIDSKKARANLGNTTQDFDTELEAQNAIDEYNRLNPGYYQYGDQQQLSLSDKELSDILNAKYTGPTDLYQTEGYSDLSNQAREAQTLQDLAGSTGYKGELLRQTFSNPNNEYTRGQKLLDDMLLGQGGVSDSLQQKAKTLGNTSSGKLSDEFNQNLNQMRGVATERNNLMDQIRKDSRSALNETATQREQAVNDRLQGVLGDWEKYPQHYRDALQNELTKHETATTDFASYNKIKDSLGSTDSRLSQLQSELAAATPAAATRAGAILRNTGSSNAARAAAQKIVNTYRNLNGVRSEIENLTNQKAALQGQMTDLNTKNNLDFEKFDPNNMNLGLSGLEAEMLGIQGGEGLYNIIKDQGIEGLIKTAEADKNKLISRDEQNQLSRLQSLAELADDYGSVDSGIDFLNKFTNRDAAGTQNALSALDMDNFTNLLQSNEKGFRDYADTANITGVGTGKATSGGAFGTKKRTSTQYLTENLGDLIEGAGGYRNMYDDSGVNTDNVDAILGLSKGLKDGTYQGNHLGLTPGDIRESLGLEGNNFLSNYSKYIGAGFDPGAGLEGFANNLQSGYNAIGQGANDVFGKDTVAADIIATPASIYADLAGKIGDVGAGLSSSLWGSSAGLQQKADQKALVAAQADLKNKINQSLIDKGYGNQLNVTQDQQRDLELLKLLGLLDTTNR